MTDYGHDLQFGSFITPSNKQPDNVVALAQVSEEVGLDLVTFQDHPYQPAFLDAWTLISFVAARTEKVKLAGNVLNLPLRQPAVLARSVASLDLLSHGRIELGLGAGAFWDGIEAMGGTKLTPGQGVDALEEAIDIIRGVWDVGAGGGVRLDGKFHRANGARRGPLPAHRVSLWLGALKPRMLDLVGRKGDGWLPSLGYIKSPTIEESNRLIDEAAIRAGRDPREIRRLINLLGNSGSNEELMSQITGLALDHGFSTFILAADDPAKLAEFGREIAPAVRDEVARVRASKGTNIGAVRTASALALRAPGIAYDALPARLTGKVVEPGDHEYSRVRSTYVHRGAPGLVIRAEDADDVVAAVNFAREQSVPLSVRSGGHGMSGRSTNDGGIVIDVGKLNSIELIDPATNRVRIGPGARWGEVAEKLSEHGLGMSSGDYGDVGVGGLATAGGIGWLSRKRGLTIDHIVAAEIVVADGRLLRVDAEHYPDLFWAIRGAGGNFGVVTTFEFEAYPVGKVVFATFVYDLTDPQGIAKWAKIVTKAPRDVTSFMIMVPARGGNPAIGQAMVVIDNEDISAAERMLMPFLEVAPVLGSEARQMPYHALVAPSYGEHDGQGGMTVHGGLVNEVTPEVAEGIGNILKARASGFVQLRAVGGAVNDIPADATAYAHRHQAFSLLATTSDALAPRLESLLAPLKPAMDGLYISFETGIGRDYLEAAFPGKTLDRLQRLKAEYDPREMFNANFNIPPLMAVAAE
ncbi:LLM class flavin-dependent oxidoreductase [Devosia sp. CN2-171]|uniref:LLM class flavin-dependent oxidoreductase n=1 Tax=Devosia sp. CN2-171 TaxID=3400909 RepID=UPI003BF88337